MRPLRREHEQAYMEKARERLAPGIDNVSAALLDGRAASALAAYAQKSGAGLIVTTTHGRSGIERAWLGSVADELARVGTVPLLLVRPEPDAVAGTFRRILAPLDGSAFAESILEHVVRLACLEPRAEVILLDVVQPVASAAWLPDGALAERGMAVSDTKRQEERAREYVVGIARRLEGVGLRVRTRAVAADNVAAVILETAHREQVDLVALATHGRSGLVRAALGSVADKVVRGSRTAILLLKPPHAGSREE